MKDLIVTVSDNAKFCVYLLIMYILNDRREKGNH
jgi:hypothetical protein